MPQPEAYDSYYHTKFIISWRKKLFHYLAIFYPLFFSLSFRLLLIRPSYFYSLPITYLLFFLSLSLKISPPPISLIFMTSPLILFNFSSQGKQLPPLLPPIQNFDFSFQGFINMKQLEGWREGGEWLFIGLVQSIKGRNKDGY